MIDNYDSFTFNLVHYFRAIGQTVEVYRNDEITLSEIVDKNPKYLVISPGPCSPNEAGISLQAIEKFAGKIPILGVCLGHQCIAQHFGGNVVKAKKPMHGKLSKVTHINSGLFENLLQPLTVTRYHSLIVEAESLPDDFIITARIANQTYDTKIDDTNAQHSGEIMGLQHKYLPIHSVQFHPESVLTEQGHDLLTNFVNLYMNYE